MRTALLASFLLLAFLPSRAQDPSVPEELQPFVPEGFTVLDFRKGDINYDKRPDYVVVFRKRGEDTLMAGAAMDEPSPRPLALIIRQANGKLVKAAENMELVLCRDCGGVMGDPYQGVEIVPGGFSLDFYGGSSWRWADSYIFRYDRRLKKWMMERQVSTSFHAGDPENTSRTETILRSEAGDIPLEKFTPGHNADSSSWQVSAAKTFFYDSPIPGSKPRKGYLLKGDRVQATRRFRHFVYVTYTNDKGDISYGYLLKKDLQLLSPSQQAGH